MYGERGAQGMFRNRPVHARGVLLRGRRRENTRDRYIHYLLLFQLHLELTSFTKTVGMGIKRM